MIPSLLLRFFRWLIRRIDPLLFIYFLMYLLVMICLCGGLNDIVLYLQPDRTLTSAFCFVLFGWVLARSHISGWKIFLLAMGFGLAWLALVVGRMYIPSGALFSALVSLGVKEAAGLILDLAQHRFGLPAVDFQQLADSWNGLGAALAALFDRLVAWFTATRSGAPLIDPLVTNLLWDAAVCLLAIWGAWFIRRKGAVITGLLPAVALLTYLLYYTNSASGMSWLIPLGGLMVLFKAVEGYQSALERWRAAHMDRIELEVGLAAVALALTAGLMLVGWAIPSVSIKEIRRDIQRYMQARQSEQLSKSLGLQQTPGSEVSSGGSILLPPVHRIGAGQHLPQDVVMDVTIDGYHPPPSAAPVGMGGREIPPTYYFRGQTYDYYTGFGWTSYPSSEKDYPAGASLFPSSSEVSNANTRSVRQYVQRSGDLGGTLFVSGELSSADQAIHVTWRGQHDLVTAQTDALAYWANSRQTLAPINRLRSAGTNYPASIRALYLQLPADLPERVRSLALDLTAQQTTPYDQAIAIEAYLRQFPYSLDVPAPDLRSDAADFFLFDLKKGYCDYYSTSMAVLARAAGIPSRIVLGYVTNLYDYDRGQFVVTAADAHSWVEIYFPGVGWVEFEPTPNLPVITNPGEVKTNLGLLPVSPAKPAIENTVAVFLGFWFHRLAPYLLGALAALVIALLLPIGRWFLMVQPSDRAVTAIYRSFYRQGRRWGIASNASRTPHEYAMEFLDRMSGQLEGQGGGALDRLRDDLDQLAGMYNRLSYSTHRLSSLDRRQAVRIWYQLRRELNWVWWRRILALPRKGQPGFWRPV